MNKVNWPLMFNNITRDDINVLVDFLNQDPIPILTNSKKVKEFEQLWSNWLGVKYSTFVNSGSSANQITMLILKQLYGNGEIIVPPITWVSDIASVLQNGFTPVFCDVNLKTLAMDENEILRKINSKTRAIFLTHVLGYNGLTQKILNVCEEKGIHLIEDVCESPGAMFNGKRVGSFGSISNFSFYYAHHMSSIEGGMICTSDRNFYEFSRAFRSHGMLRETTDEFEAKSRLLNEYTDLNKDFIFISPAYNMRSTEINAVVAINQLKRLDDNNIKRKNNLDIFLDNLDSKKYYTEFNREGNSNYAFTLLLKNENFESRDKIERVLKENDIEFRRGMSGGGNQLRQPYLRQLFDKEFEKYPNANYVHHFGWYIGNYPELEKEKILYLTNVLNRI